MLFFTSKTSSSNTSSSFTPSKLVMALGCLFLFVGNVSAHGRMLIPQIRIKPGDADQGFSITNGPTKTEPCAGNPPGTVLTNYQPGQSVPIQWKITAAHRGNCTVELSTTGKDSDFKALKFFDACAEQDGDFSDTFQLPADVQCDKCTVRWVWRALLTDELYLNCADVSIGSGSTSSPSQVASPKRASTTTTPPKHASTTTTPLKHASTMTTSTTTTSTMTTSTMSSSPKSTTARKTRPKNGSPKKTPPSSTSSMPFPTNDPGKHRKRNGVNARDQKIARRNLVRNSVM